MSYRKKHNPGKSKKKEREEQTLICPEYALPGEEQSISTTRLLSGQPYQRPVEKCAVDRLIQTWDERLLEPLVVSFRDGNFYVVDGQHRVAAMRKMNDGANVMVPCRVFSGMTYAEEAMFCYRLDRAKRRLTMAQSTRALLEASVNQELNDIEMRIRRAGLQWALEKSHGRNHEITNTRAVVLSYRALGGEGFSRMLGLIEKTWNGSVVSLGAMMLSGMTLFLKTYGDELDDQTFVQRMSATDALEIVRRAKTDFSTNRNALRCARVILSKYNAPRGGRKLKYKFRG